jgi:hypothetical protein
MFIVVGYLRLTMFPDPMSCGEDPSSGRANVMAIPASLKALFGVE